jgi:hypothetical protein
MRRSSPELFPVFQSRCEDPRPAPRWFVGSEAGPGADLAIFRPLYGCLLSEVSPPALTFMDRPDLIEALITQRGIVDRPLHLKPVRGGRNGQAASEEE